MHSLVLSKAQNRTQSPALCPREKIVYFMCQIFVCLSLLKLVYKMKSFTAFKGWVHSVLGLFSVFHLNDCSCLSIYILDYEFISSIIGGCVLVVSSILNVKPINDGS